MKNRILKIKLPQKKDTFELELRKYTFLTSSPNNFWWYDIKQIIELLNLEEHRLSWALEGSTEPSGHIKELKEEEASKAHIAKSAYKYWYHQLLTNAGASKSTTYRGCFTHS